MVNQRRDNWSREQVRSLRRKLRNVKDELRRTAESKRSWARYAGMSHGAARRLGLEASAYRTQVYTEKMAFQRTLAAANARIAELEAQVEAEVDHHESAMTSVQAHVAASLDAANARIAELEAEVSKSTPNTSDDIGPCRRCDLTVSKWELIGSHEQMHDACLCLERVDSLTTQNAALVAALEDAELGARIDRDDHVVCYLCGNRFGDDGETTHRVVCPFALLSRLPAAESEPPHDQE